ncbi:putative hydrolase [Clostridiaceae bacterium JG1575]|nr:putative hydrolase [Clostridiaceae bacterium JG1575]
MFGAIVGDIAGSIYEWNNIKTKEFELFQKNCFFTDDSVMTVATADALMRGGRPDDFIDAYKEWGRRFPDVGYGERFLGWVLKEDRGPNHSWGNGSAMRVSPCAFWGRADYDFTDPELFRSARTLAERSARTTHDHPEGIKGALAITDAILIARSERNRLGVDFNQESNTLLLAECKEKIRRHTIAEYGYNLSRSLEEIRPTYQFNGSCQGTVPPAMEAALESCGFEDALRNAISLGGDSDTLAAISCSLAEALYGIPEAIKQTARSFLDPALLKVLERWEHCVKE